MLLTLAAFAPAYATQGFLQGNLQIDLKGRLVVLPNSPSPFPEDIRLTVVDGQGRAVADITISENTKTTSFRSVRGGMAGEVRLFRDGTFRLRIPRGEQRFLLRLRPHPTSGSSVSGYFVKSALVGSVDVLAKPIVVGPSVAEELVITVEMCAPATQDRC
jgi:hypothetical protein